MINDQEYIDSIPAYVLGALDSDEIVAFEARLAQDDALRAEVLNYQELVADLPLAVAPVRPPATLKARLLAQAVPTHLSPPATPPAATRIKPSRRRIWPMFAAVGAVLLLVCLSVTLGVVYRRLQMATETNQQLAAQLEDRSRALDELRRLQQETGANLDLSRRRAADLESQLNANSATLARLQQEIAVSEQLVSYLSAADITTRDLQAINGTSSAQGAMFMRPGQRDAVVVVSGLPPLAPGENYQFWLAQDGAAVQFNAGMLVIGDNGSGQLVVQAPLAVNDFAEVMVTLEHEQHATSPSSTTLLYGRL